MASEETSKDNSSNNDKQNSQTTTTTSTEISDYRRKKNWISGVDNDTVTLSVAGVALLGVGLLAFFPNIKELVSNIANRNQQQQIAPPPPPQIEEPYIPPTEPLPPPSPQQPQPEQQPMQQEQQQQQTEDIPDTFYDDELKKRREMITGRRHLKYDSQFGAGIANS